MKLSIKFLLFLLPLCIVIGINIYYLNQNQINKFDKHATYFIGSSRVQRGIDPQLLNDNKEENKIYNFGISSSTFFHNIILAKHLIIKHKAKELFIELSPIIHSYHPAPESLNMGITSMTAAIKYLSINGYIEYVESYLFTRLSLKTTLKKLIQYNGDSLDKIGYRFNDKNKYYTTDSFLKIEDLEMKTDDDLSEYFDLILQLTQLAKKQNTKIRFFLPLTFQRKQEREIVSTIFNRLPNEQKVKYTEDFLNSISNADNLYDKNHFNNKGAKIMTTYFKNAYFTD